MSAPPKVEVRGLTKRFKLYPGPAARLAEWMTLGAWKRHTDFTALDNISFTVRAGEFFGILGPNGAGKSTLLKVLTGVLIATEGHHRIDGRVTSLLELGTGFNPELTGKENILNSARLLGLAEHFIRDRFDEIIDFSDLEEHIDVPVKYYSSGMVVRLAFAMFAHIEPDVFIVDEALSVGDVAFSQKCFARLDRMRAAGCTLLFASHDLAAIRKYCDQALFLDHGKCIFLGSAVEASDVYLEAVSPGGRLRGVGVVKPISPASPLEPSKAAHSAAFSASAARLSPSLARIFDENSFHRIQNTKTARVGTGQVRLVALQLLDESGQPRTSYTIGQRLRLHLLAQGMEDIAHATVSFQLVNRMGIVVWGTNHALHSGYTTAVRKGEWLHAVFDVKLDIHHEQYAVDVGWGDASGEGHVFDRITAASSITVSQGIHADFVGLARLDCVSDVKTYPADSTPDAQQLVHELPMSGAGTKGP